MDVRWDESFKARVVEASGERNVILGLRREVDELIESTVAVENVVDLESGCIRMCVDDASGVGVKADQRELGSGTCVELTPTCIVVTWMR